MGCIRVKKTLYKPTRDRFCEWLFRYDLLDTEPFRGYLVGGFASNFDTWDIDICLTNKGSEPEDYEKLEWVLFNATKMALVDNSIFVDICWQDYIPDYSKDMSQYTVKKYILADKIYRDGVLVTENKDAERISKNLWRVEETIPKSKQLARSGKYAAPVSLKSLNSTLWETSGGRKKLRRVL